MSEAGEPITGLADVQPGDVVVAGDIPKIEPIRIGSACSCSICRSKELGVSPAELYFAEGTQERLLAEQERNEAIVAGLKAADQYPVYYETKARKTRADDEARLRAVLAARVREWEI